MNDLAIRTVTGAALIALAVGAALVGGNIFALIVAAIATLMFYEWTRVVRGWGPLWYIGGFVYALVPALALLWIRERYAQGLELLLWVFVISWATDIGAYFVGRALGKRKLAPSISPNKTVEGLIGGMIAATLVGGALVLWAGLDRDLLWFAPVFAAAAQGGDLFESWMKRRADIKDSGSWLPGHGGILDRLDGLVVVAILTVTAQLAGLL